MPEMYKEVHGEGEYNLERSETGVTGIRTFIRDDTNGTVAVASLPVVGTDLMYDHVAAASVTGCICRSSSAVYKQGLGTVPGYTYRYSTEEWSAGGNPGASVPQDDSHEEWEAGADVDTFVPNPNIATGDYWIFESAASDVNIVEQSLPIVHQRGSFSLPHPNQAMDGTAKTAFFTKVKAQAGTINNAAFRDLAEGQVMFRNVTGGSYRTSTGALRYAFMLHFEWRTIQDPIGGAPISTDAWLYVVNEQEGRLRKPKTNVSGAYLYRKTTFADLLA